MKKLSFLIIAVIVLVFHVCTEKQEVVEQTHEDGTPKTVVKFKFSWATLFFRNCFVALLAMP